MPRSLYIISLARVALPTPLLVFSCFFKGFVLTHLTTLCMHYYQSEVQFTSLNHYGTLKVK
jgi:hypothetical protein